MTTLSLLQGPFQIDAAARSGLDTNHETGPITHGHVTRWCQRRGVPRRLELPGAHMTHTNTNQRPGDKAGQYWQLLDLA